MSDGRTIPIVVVGEAHLVEGFALGGARVVPAERPEDVHRAWRDLPPEAVVVLTASAALALEDIEDGGPRSGTLTAVMPR